MSIGVVQKSSCHPPIPVIVLASPRNSLRTRYLCVTAVGYGRLVHRTSPAPLTVATPPALADIVLASAPFGISLTSSLPESFGTYVFANPAYSRITGYSAEELRALTFRDIVHPDDLPEAVAGLRRLLSGEVAEIDTELRIRRRDGTQITVRQHRTAVSDAAGEPLWTVTHSEDITERRASDAAVNAARVVAENALLESEARYRLLADNAPDMIVCTQRDRTRTYISPGSQRLLGYTPAELLGGDFAGLLHPGDRARIIRAYDDFLERGGPDSHTYRMRRKDGEYVWAEARWVNMGAAHFPLRSGSESDVLVAVVRDISERKAAEMKIASMACHDALTGLANRVLLRERLDEARSFVDAGGSVAVLLIDLDRFKAVNDMLGHAVGDKVLQAVAERLLRCVREDDTVARLGGDEFAIVLLGLDDQQEATRRAQDIVEVLSACYDVAGHRVLISASVGVTTSPQDGVLSDQLLKNADSALYGAKAAGRRGYRIFQPSMAVHRQTRLDTEGELRDALAAGSFEVFYQPILKVATDAIVGFEALVRWRHPVRGLIYPEHFVPIAEDTGIIVPLGEWVLREACRQASRWPAGVRVSVNVSPIQFRTAAFIETVRGALAASGLHASRLDLEVTESVLLQQTGETLAVLNSLRQLGVTISLDDFGTGYSSLGYLRNFRFDRIKIDRSFIGDLGRRDESDAVVRAVVGIGAALAIVIVAEGVETHAQLQRLRQLGCVEAQGFLYCDARPAAEIPALLAAFQSDRLAVGNLALA
jgi:diguanylate cyclase (GGDEF)-like protein/PAS domain S-box-containing protein